MQSYLVHYQLHIYLFTLVWYSLPCTTISSFCLSLIMAAYCDLVGCFMGSVLINVLWILFYHCYKSRPWKVLCPFLGVCWLSVHIFPFVFGVILTMPGLEGCYAACDPLDMILFYQCFFLGFVKSFFLWIFINLVILTA